MHRSTKSRIGRILLIGFLLLTQFLLLWMAEFHWDEETLPLPVSAQTIRATHRHATPADQKKNPCTVCLIVRQNAVRPSTGSPTPQPVTTVYFRSVIPPKGFHTHLPSVAFGRAPPLS